MNWEQKKARKRDEYNSCDCYCYYRVLLVVNRWKMYNFAKHFEDSLDLFLALIHSSLLTCFCVCSGNPLSSVLAWESMARVGNNILWIYINICFVAAIDVCRILKNIYMKNVALFASIYILWHCANKFSSLDFVVKRINWKIRNKMKLDEKKKEEEAAITSTAAVAAVTTS